MSAVQELKNTNLSEGGQAYLRLVEEGGQVTVEKTYKNFCAAERLREFNFSQLVNSPNVIKYEVCIIPLFSILMDLIFRLIPCAIIFHLV